MCDSTKFVEILNSKICFPFKAKNTEDIECQVRFLLTANEYVFATFCPRDFLPFSNVSSNRRRMINFSIFIDLKGGSDPSALTFVIGRGIETNSICTSFGVTSRESREFVPG